MIGPPGVPAAVVASETKGLGFDAVLVVAPERILADGPRGAAELYVTLTRATQRLGVLHQGQLPQALTGHRNRDAHPGQKSMVSVAIRMRLALSERVTRRQRKLQGSFQACHRAARRPALAPCLVHGEDAFHGAWSTIPTARKACVGVTQHVGAMRRDFTRLSTGAG